MVGGDNNYYETTCDMLWCPYENSGAGSGASLRLEE